HLQAFVEVKLRSAVLGDFAASLALARAEDLAFDERTVIGFELGQLGKGLRHREFVRIARIDTRDQRINGMIEKLLTKPPHDKFGNTLLFTIATRGHKRLAQDR